MKFSILKNDKSTAKDEIILLLIVLFFIGMGVTLMLIKPTFWFIDENDTLVFGVLMLIAGVMYIPGLIYRFMKNDTRKKIKKIKKGVDILRLLSYNNHIKGKENSSKSLNIIL